MAIFLIKAFDCGLIAYECHHNVTILCFRRFVYDHNIVVKDTGIDHTGTGYTQGKQFTRLVAAARVGDVILDLFHGKDGQTGRDFADQRNPRHRFTRKTDGSVKAALARYISAFFEHLQIGVNS